MAPSVLSPTQRYAAGALLAFSLRQAQIHQTCPLGFEDVGDGDDEVPDRHSSSSNGSSGGSSEGDDGLWTHESRGLLRPVFRFLEIDPMAWPGLEETAASSPAKNHIGAFLRILFEESDETSAERLEQALALIKSVDAMEMSLKETLSSVDGISEEYFKYRQEYHKEVSPNMTNLREDEACKLSEAIQQLNCQKLPVKDECLSQADGRCQENPFLQDTVKNNQQKVAVLYELLSACVADLPEDHNQQLRHRKGYDARLRVALRSLATWLNIKWKKMEAMEIMVACSAMAAAKEEAQAENRDSDKSRWSRWKRHGIIGAAAVTGGTLLAITEVLHFIFIMPTCVFMSFLDCLTGLAAPAIAAGFGALAPTLGTLMPVIGASGFAAIASAAGSVAGSVAVAASFGAAGAGLSGSKMARRTGSIEEFEFIPIGQNHNQGCLAVGILISGFVFEKEDFVRPWEGTADNLETYAVQWESKNLIAVSTAIQDWLTSSLTMGLMKQGAMMTVLSTLVSALAWPATLLSATNFIDSKWAISVDRSDKAGKLMAEVLLKGLQGNRPVTLVGFSLGARVIFKCLQHLAETGDNEGLIERVVLLGAPISLKSEPWESARRMVAGRFVNVYSTNDWILGVTFLTGCYFLLQPSYQGLAGIQPVDVTDLIDGHSSYLWSVRQILEQLELDTYYPVFSCSSRS
ncbi:unnamed protein product [Spirodela intermedia]|uniref:Uncharacterized protein n=1 Tax=Spirodela intermedia TaxID=51605 RepID=A0A7I8JV81_SPIIN|nr:unnamed protein product [Spirodela intermedia]CAA6673675.1 unnamed protein product [Spirodela intermedia]